MLFDYQYTVMAVLFTLVLLILVYQRRSYSSASNRVFMSLLYVNLLASAVDVVTFWTISFPSQFPVWFCWASNILYIWLFGLVSATFLRYITALTQRRRFIRIGWIAWSAAIVLEGTLLLSSVQTHWIVYYDENMVYRHGPLFWVMYFIPVVLISIAQILLWNQKEKFNHFQRLTAVTVFAIALVLAAIQIMYPKMDMFHMMCTLILLAVFAVFENPAYYTYHTTRCLNRRAFYDECRRQLRIGGNPRILLIGVLNRPRNTSLRESAFITRLQEEAAEQLCAAFGRNVYCFEEGKFVLLLRDNSAEAEAAVQTKIQNIFDRGLRVGGNHVKIIYALRSIFFSETRISDDFIDHMTECFAQLSAEELFHKESIPSELRQMHEYREIEDALSKAFANDGFHIAYQPIRHSSTQKCFSVEALLRLNDSVLGNISPEYFIPVAEKNGSIVAIGEMVFEKVCSFLASEQCRTAGIRFAEINISPVQLRQQNMAGHYLDILHRNKVEPDRVVLEITETALNITDEAVVTNIRLLRESGIHFALDDYGSGFASVDYLFRLPISVVKIDRSILARAMEDNGAMIVFRDMVSMVKKLNKNVVVEGTETLEMLQVAESAGSDFTQGYYYSMPLIENELLAFMRGINE